ncbi:MAG: hypothetical protein HN413_08030 [Chloroflexi bacterium]|nr:hypothetical protein [Chloroflexota bacterium]
MNTPAQTQVKAIFTRDQPRAVEPEDVRLMSLRIQQVMSDELQKLNAAVALLDLTTIWHDLLAAYAYMVWPHCSASENMLAEDTMQRAKGNIEALT